MRSRSESTIRVFLVEDQEIFEYGIRLLLQSEPGLTLAGRARTCAEALSLELSAVDIILLGIDPGEESGLEFLPELLEAAYPARAVVLAEKSDPDLCVRALRLGAMGVFLKSESPQVMLKAIRRVHSGETWLERTMFSNVLSNLLKPPKQEKVDPEAEKIAMLTPRELEIISALGQGKRNKHIAERLFISEKTVCHHLTSVFEKLGVSDRLELMVYALRYGLIPMPIRPQGQQADGRD